MPGEKPDCVIVGAAVSGLGAARSCSLGAAGRQVVMLEARERVRGRLCIHQFAGHGPVEIGGQWGVFTGPGLQLHNAAAATPTVPWNRDCGPQAKCCRQTE